MASSASKLKRKVSVDGGVSPPPLRRKVSSTTQSAVASFFTPLSQKPPDQTIWQERGSENNSLCTLLFGRYEPKTATTEATPGRTAQQRRKVAAFDFDATLVQTISGKKHASEPQDWRWWHASVPETLRKLYYDDGYLIVIFSNQAGIALKSNTKAPKAHHSRLTALKSKMNVVLSQLDLPINIYAATEKDMYRKPRTGMWKELLEDFDLNAPNSINLAESFFVGDAGGRVVGPGLVGDFSSSDRDFAENIGIKFQTPEEFFLNQPPRVFRRKFDPTRYTRAEAPEPFSKRNPQEIILCCGSPGAGKSTFYWKHLQPLQYERINQDLLKTRERCLKIAEVFLSEGKSVAVDNTNANKEVRGKWIELATKQRVPIRCVLFLTEPELCEHNDAVRALNHVMNPEKRVLLPGLAFSGFRSRYQKPELSEGFQDIVEIKFQFQGTEAERSIWTRYWT